jgi:hypothetical protein
MRSSSRRCQAAVSVVARVSERRMPAMASAPLAGAFCVEAMRNSAARCAVA